LILGLSNEVNILLSILHSKGITDFKFSSFLTKKKERKKERRQEIERRRTVACSVEVERFA